MSTTAGGIINEALQDLGVIRPNETPSTSVTTDCLLRLNQRLAAHSIEKLIAQTQKFISFPLSTNTSRYTVGVGGNFNTAARAEGIIAWKATNGVLTSGGDPLTMADFDTQAAQAQAAFTAAVAQAAADEAAVAAKVQASMAMFFVAPAFSFPTLALSGSQVPMILGADSASPLLNIAVFPTPGPAPAVLELAYWTALTQFATAADVVALPDGWEDFLHFDLAMALYPRYARQGFDPTVLASQAQNAKAKIVELNKSQQAAK